MRALTVRQPWAWGLIHGGKDVENRNWAPARGLAPDLFDANPLRILIHTGLAFDTAAAHPHPDLDMPNPRTLPRGVTYGLVTVRTWHASSVCGGSCSPWAEVDAAFHWEISDPQPVEPVPTRGALQLWRCDDSLIHPLG